MKAQQELNCDFGKLKIWKALGSGYVTFFDHDFIVLILLCNTYLFHYMLIVQWIQRSLQWYVFIQTDWMEIKRVPITITVFMIVEIGHNINTKKRLEAPKFCALKYVSDLIVTFKI